MADYLLEIGTEEIPAKFMPGALAELQAMAAAKLKEHRISFKSLRTMGTPRRLVLYIEDLAAYGEDLKEEVRGPAKKAAFDATGAPTKAAKGFARSQGVPVESLIVKETGNGEYLFALKEVKGKATEELLPELAVQLVTGLSFPKPMRWGSIEMRFARPIRWLVSLFDEKVIPFSLAGLQAGRRSRGHRFLGQPEIEIKSPQTYPEQMRENYVMVDQEERREECWRQIQEQAARVNGRVKEDSSLLEEVIYLLEWPTALTGSIAEEYLQMPEEVVITPMREHQRYFPVRDGEGKLLPYFITVRNGNADHIHIVRAGNERVLKARLADARFFWEEDQKKKLEDYLPQLEKVVFQEKLGTIAQKSERVVRLVGSLTARLQVIDAVAGAAARAAQLAKADLVTNMVYEFPELQGIMGRYYALLSGEKEEVAQAILEHYQPRFAGDVVPASTAGAIVSIADKMDTLAGCFAIGIEPTGSQDPYALRRQAMGVCQILLAHGFEVHLDHLIASALTNYRAVLDEAALGENTAARLKEFFQSRIKNILADRGHRYDVIDAVLGVEYGDLLSTVARAEALTSLRDNEQFQDLLRGYTRASNLAAKKEEGEINPAYFSDDTEKVLFAALENTAAELAPLEVKRDFQGMITILAALAEPIDRFFDAVMVMAEDRQVRINRLGLLAEVVALTKKVGDLGKIVVDK
ncbi:MAG TPA: glycine--tRNA ligase subunit beta [Peptococcaceae bacterium]|jgi:glycyl-tRNA synthetase beta chain|nr:glycine--tRNA ligase subunit beta [Peptococcaceae bacterium]HQD54058.1 glycine--tRNA ligase subunit beta [Peptococcaceae bacterium]